MAAMLIFCFKTCPCLEKSLSKKLITASRKVLKTKIQHVWYIRLFREGAGATLSFKLGNLIAGLWLRGRSVKELPPALHVSGLVRLGMSESSYSSSSLSILSRIPACYFFFGLSNALCQSILMLTAMITYFCSRLFPKHWKV